MTKKYYYLWKIDTFQTIPSILVLFYSDWGLLETDTVPAAEELNEDNYSFNNLKQSTLLTNMDQSTYIIW